MQSVVSIFIGGIFLVLSETLYGKVVLNQNPKLSFYHYIVLLIIMASIYTGIYENIDGNMCAMLNCFTHVIMFKMLFNISIAKSFLLTFVYAILLLIPDMIILLVSIDLLGIDKNYYYNVFAGSGLANLLVCIVLIIVVLILKKPLQKLFNYNLETSKKNIIYMILTFVCVVMIFYEMIANFKVVSHSKIMTLILMLGAFVTVLFSFFKEKIVNNNLSTKYDRLLDFMKVYENEIEKQRINNHEIRNQYTTLRSMILDKVSDKNIIEYLDEITSEVKRINNQDYAKFKYLPANGLKGLFYFKVDEAQRKMISVSVNISKKVENSMLFKLNAKNFNQLGKIIGVYLDNAIEASEASEEKSMCIEIYTIKDDISIIISNSFTGKIDGKIGIEKFSTKGAERGHGLMLVKTIINNNKIFESKSEIVKNIYIQKLKIKNKVSE